MKIQLSKLLISLGCLVTAGCSSDPAPFLEQLFGVPGVCVPTRAQPTARLFTPGGIALSEASSLSDVTFTTSSPTGFEGEILFAIVEDEEVVSFGGDYDEELALDALPSEVMGPGVFRFAFVVEQGGGADTIRFEEFAFSIDGERHQSPEVFDLEFVSGNC